MLGWAYDWEGLSKIPEMESSPSVPLALYLSPQVLHKQSNVLRSVWLGATASGGRRASPLCVKALIVFLDADKEQGLEGPVALCLLADCSE